MRAPRRVAFLGVLGIAVALLAGLAGPAAGVAPRDVGWWWRMQAGLPVAVPPPPDVPEGGMLVEGVADGPNAIAALRFALPRDHVPVRLSLPVAAEQGGAQALLLACPGDGWIPVHAGRWDNRPLTDCEGKGVLGMLADDGQRIDFELGLLPAGAFLDLVLVPGREESRLAGADGSVFRIVFDAPGAQALTTRSEAGDGGVVTPPGVGEEPREQPWQPSQEPESTPGFGVPGTEPADPSAEAGEPPAVVEPPEVRDPSALEPAVSAAREPVDSRDGRVLATLIALLSVGVAGVLSRERAPAPVGGRDGAPQMGGIGRFQRPRTGPPPPL